MLSFFGNFIDLMAQALELLNGVVHNYGLAIILFTLIIKFALLPLTIKQTKSMKAMQDIQPEMKKIQDKYEDDKEKQQEEMMKLYQENDVNPAAGCLPMILQLVILIPLYRAILSLQGVMGDATFLWIGRLTDGSLAQPDPALVIINGLAMVGQTYITQKISGSGGQGSTMMWIMPIFIVFIGFQLPSGLLLYWLTSTIFTAIQQFLISGDSGVKEATN
ncbi:MAG TPA: YidC/Oxa1 family membrane protein insertase [Halanaerobiales bacterium]|nr:YidC/Oxa1 family membrane protein insertase [Halanaerobiales bacterium]